MDYKLVRRLIKLRELLLSVVEPVSYEEIRDQLARSAHFPEYADDDSGRRLFRRDLEALTELGCRVERSGGGRQPRRYVAYDED